MRPVGTEGNEVGKSVDGMRTVGLGEGMKVVYLDILVADGVGP